MIQNFDEKKALIKQNNDNGFKELITNGDILEYSIADTGYSIPNGGVIVDLPDNKKGIAIAVVQPDYYVAKNKSANKVKILNSDGSEYLDLSEPELIDVPHANVKIARDDNYLYVTTYNTSKSYLAKYEMKTFDRKWKKTLEDNSMQSITVNNSEVICFNMTNGSIDYFNKENGEIKKSINIKESWGHHSQYRGHLHHNISATDLNLLAGVPGTDYSVNFPTDLPIDFPKDMLFDLPNELKVFNDEGDLINQKKISINVGILNAVSVDKDRQLAYVAFDNNVSIFGPKGFIGNFSTSNGKITELNVDNSSGALIISSTNAKSDNGGIVDILGSKAIMKLVSLNKANINAKENIPEISEENRGR